MLSVSTRTISGGISSKFKPLSMASKWVKKDGPDVSQSGFKSPGRAPFCLQMMMQATIIQVIPLIVRMGVKIKNIQLPFFTVDALQMWRILYNEEEQ
jgi:hypothetical protein